MATISLCMIVRDEEAVLARCLDSVRELVDEIVIADTGSTDRTKEIAERYTDRIYDFPWRDDFAAARNFAFSKATMDYILWLDADDVLLPEDAAAFAAFKAHGLAEAEAVMLPYNTAFDEDGNPIFSYYRERLVRRCIPHRWEGRVHEVLTHQGRTTRMPIAVTHRSVKKSYTDRNLRIYEAQIASGEALSPRDLFYYGRELYYHGRYDDAILVLLRFLNGGQGWVENNIEACKILSWCYGAQKDEDAAVDALMRSFRYDTPRSEICCELGRHFLQAENYASAIFWYRLALDIPRSDASGAFVSVDCYGYLPCIQLCVCYDRIGDRQQAEAYNEKAGTYRPRSPAYLHNKAYFDSLKARP